MKLRIKFAKYGPMVFIGHLDVMRYFQKAIRRAQIDVTYTTGFSPHQVMSFAQPLGVGLYSDGEYFDIGINTLTSCEDIMERLNAQMVEGFKILSVKVLPDQAVNAMASVQAALYTIRFRKGYEPDFDLFASLDEFYNRDEIIVTKETKKSTKEFNLKDYIYDFSYNKDKQEIYMLLNASSSGNIKPALVMKSIYEYTGHTPGEFDFLITRNETFTRKDETVISKDNFIPLSEVGDDQ